MRCPFCSHPDTQVIDTRANDELSIVRRRRRCVICDKRFTTYERFEARMPHIIKRSGGRQEYSRQKLMDSLRIALRKRPVSTEAIDAVIDHIESRLLLHPEKEIASMQVGNWVMVALQSLDKVAWIRFASVYYNFDHVDEFKNVLTQL